MDKGKLVAFHHLKRTGSSATQPLRTGRYLNGEDEVALREFRSLSERREELRQRVQNIDKKLEQAKATMRSCKSRGSYEIAEYEVRRIGQEKAAVCSELANLRENIKRLGNATVEHVFKNVAFESLPRHIFDELMRRSHAILDEVQ